MANTKSFILKVKEAKHTLIKLLKEGIHPKKLAWSVTCGIVVGLFPVLFTTTLITLAFSIVFRLNIIAAQLVNWLMTPLHIMCMIPFLKAGEWLVGATDSGITVEVLQQEFVYGFWKGMNLILHTQLLAILAWSIIALPLSFIVYTVFHRVFKTYLAK